MELIITSIEVVGGKIKEKPFPRYTYKESMEKFNADKYDLRSEDEKKNNIFAFAWVTEFPVFEKNDKGGLTYSHNPFTGMTPESEEKLIK